MKFSEFLFYKTKEFLSKNNKISDEWNSLNVLSTDAATVGNIDLGIINNEINLISDLKNHKFDDIAERLFFEKPKEVWIVGRRPDVLNCRLRYHSTCIQEGRVHDKFGSSFSLFLEPLMYIEVLPHSFAL